MKLFSSDGSLAIFAIGPAPIGIFAVGQVARGVIALGQGAVGVIAVGQLCVSIIGVGQAGMGVTWFGAMAGVGGRGLCLRLIPGIDPPRTPPKEIPFQSFYAGVSEGFVGAQVLRTPSGPRLGQHGAQLPIKMTPAVLAALREAGATGSVKELYAHMKVIGRTIVCDRLVEVPGTRSTFPLWLQCLRVAGLVGISAIWWYAFTTKF
jgi:hypothetical protein